ncbi:hypothetical protein HPB49_019680 [Dermacentor silvarum]|uniref:Uncharacterized protein n=1 Tax=Dermacentor silvarum TaxID=543639 RepID=A0ACB8CMJ2_DERSI|nr:hypothetical protein HPB49_019680 [Dermacentor silvarum]
MKDIVFRCELALSRDHRRPFYVIGHMVNSLEEVDDFVEGGANALEADIEFADDGTVQGTFHGAPCDCFRGCFKRESIVDYLEYIRDATGYDDSRYKNKLNLLLLDLKTAKLGQSAKKKAGLTLAMNLWEHLWEGVNPKNMVNVLLSIGYVNDKRVLKSVLAYFNRKGRRHVLDKIGFDVGMNDPLEKIAVMYKQLGIKRHRHGVDGIITNRPDNVLYVLNSEPYRDHLRVADVKDSPWTRYDEEMARNDTDHTTEVLGGEDEGKGNKTLSWLKPSQITSLWTH